MCTCDSEEQSGGFQQAYGSVVSDFLLGSTKNIGAQISDLFTFEKSLWPRPTVTESNAYKLQYSIHREEHSTKEDLTLVRTVPTL